jgi:hypothetical protein
MVTSAPRVAPALMLTLLVCGCAASSSDNRKQISLEYSSCQTASKRSLQSCDQLMEMDASTSNASGYIEIGHTGSSVSRHDARSR